MTLKSEEAAGADACFFFFFSFFCGGASPAADHLLSLMCLKDAGGGGVGKGRGEDGGGVRVGRSRPSGCWGGPVASSGTFFHLAGGGAWRFADSAKPWK